MAKRNSNIDAELRRIIDEGSSLKVRQPPFVGQRLKAGLNRFVEALLRLNETIPASAKLTDDVICSMIREEFAKHEPTVKYFSKDNPLASYRGKYNRGDLLRTDPEAMQKRFLSVPYSKDGVPFRNRRPMTKMEYLASAAKFGLGVILDERTGQIDIQTTEHFGVVPKERFGLRVTSKKKAPAKARA